MPRMLEFPARWVNSDQVTEFYPVATEDELLEFANKMRIAGEAQPLEALLPSTPKRSRECLIARALNFSCEIGGMGFVGDGNFRYEWCMELPPNATLEQAKKLSEATGVPLMPEYDNYPVLGPLPAHIGNAADAFDMGLAFQDLIRDDNAADS